MRINGLSDSMAWTPWKDLLLLFTGLYLAGPARCSPIFVGSPRFIDSILLPPPVKNVKATLVLFNLLP